MITEIPSGVVSDALGRRRTLAFSFAIYIFSFLIFYFSTGYLVFLVAMILFAIGDAFRSGVHKAMIFAYLKHNGWENYKVDYYGKTRSWSQTGSAISAIIAAIFVFYKEEYEIIFLLSIVPYVLDFFLILSYPGFLDGDKVIFSAQRIFQKFKKVVIASIQSVKQFAFLSTLLSLTVYTGFYKSTKDYIQPVIQTLALSAPFLLLYNDNQKVALTTGAVYSILFFISAFASRNASRLMKALHNYSTSMNVTLLTGLVVGIIMGISYYFKTPVIAVVGFAAIIIIENLRKPIGVSIIAELSKNEAMATTLSITSQSKSLIVAVIAPILGYFADLYSPGIAMGIISLILIVLIPFLWLKKI